MRICIKTYGCTHNTADSERMAGLLKEQGHDVASEEEADLLIVNSCTVKGPAEQRFWHDLERAQQRGQRVVAAGCVPQSQPGNERLADIPIVGVKEIQHVAEVVDAAARGETLQRRSHREQPSLGLPRARKNEHVEIIPINDGCLGSCSYCATVLARGRLQSHPREAVVNAVRAATREGAREIWLTSEDTGAWGRDRGETLPELLEAIAAIPGDFMVRIGMANPPLLREHVPELIRILSTHPRFYRFLHVPVQSGSDAVLGRMKREYAVADFLDVVEPMREALPGMTLMTDYIVGFPGETEEEFEATMALARRGDCRILNINRFYPRPGTPAARMPKVPTHITAARVKRLVELYESQQPNEHLAGTRQRILIAERGKRGVVGHNRDYVQVVLPDGDESLLGTWQDVEILEANKYYLIGRTPRPAPSEPLPDSSQTPASHPETKS